MKTLEEVLAKAQGLQRALYRKQQVNICANSGSILVVVFTANNEHLYSGMFVDGIPSSYDAEWERVINFAKYGKKAKKRNQKAL